MAQVDHIIRIGCNARNSASDYLHLRRAKGQTGMGKGPTCAQHAILCHSASLSNLLYHFYNCRDRSLGLINHDVMITFVGKELLAVRRYLEEGSLRGSMFGFLIFAA